MANQGSAVLGGVGYRSVRALVLGVGLIVLVLLAALLYVRRVDTIEVVATLLYVPTFLAFVAWKEKGGGIAGVCAGATYIVLRYPAVEAIGLDRFLGVFLWRALAFVAFGVLGGWAIRQLETSLFKLEVYDQIDDRTGLNNARFFVQDVDLEMARSRRYRTVFSVSLVDLPADALERLGRRRQAAALRGLGEAVQRGVRQVDRAVHARQDGWNRLAFLLPETGPEGVQIFTSRMAERVAAYLSDRRVAVAMEDLRQVSATFPGDDALMQQLRDQFADIDRREHPEASEISS